MAISEAKKRADARWHKKAYDDVVLKIRKDAEFNSDFIRSHAESMGESVNAFVKRAIKETIENDENIMNGK